LTLVIVDEANLCSPCKIISIIGGFNLQIVMCVHCLCKLI